MICAEVNVRVGEISDVVMRLRKKILHIMINASCTYNSSVYMINCHDDKQAPCLHHVTENGSKSILCFD